MMLLISMWLGLLLVGGLGFIIGWVSCMFWMNEPDNYMKVKDVDKKPTIQSEIQELPIAPR